MFRYALLGYFAAKYGHQIVQWAKRNSPYMLYALLALLAVGIVAVGAWAIHRRRKGQPFLPKGEAEAEAA